MTPDTIFLGVDARDFDGMSGWWSRLLGRDWDRVPMPSCREWSLTDDVLFQVRDNPEREGKATVTMRVSDLDTERTRLREAGIDIPDPVDVDGFDTLRFVEFRDPEGNRVGLLDGR